MTTPITFPRAIPDVLPFAGMSFYPDPMLEIAPLRSGRQISKDLGPTLWRGKVTSATMGAEDFDVVRAWYSTLLSKNSFYGYDRARQYPAAYSGGFAGLTVGGSPFDGTCKIDDVESNNVVIALKDLPAGFIFTVGDYLAFDYGADSRALHRVVAAATASGAGAVSLEVRPHVRVGWAEDDVVSLYRASAEMIIVPGTYQEQTQPPDFGTLSFEAIQTL